MLPSMGLAMQINPDCFKERLLIIAEGFERRALSWIQFQPQMRLFSNAIICKYEPEQIGRFEEVYGETKLRSANDPVVLEYNRFDPTPFEQSFNNSIAHNKFNEIIIDISVMSKLLIMIVLHALREYSGCIKLVYTEPKTWSPSESDYTDYVEKHKDGMSYAGLSSIGVFDILKTPGLSSIVMQDSQPKLITFTSSNEQLLVSVLNEVVPARTVLINATNKREPWRANAALEIHKRVIESFGISDCVACFELLDYRGVFSLLAKEYSKDCYTHRIIIAPTGGKIHTIACALIKNCCSDIHIEYPTPEGYVFNSYSSDEIENIHEICFPRFNELLKELRIEYKLDG